MRLRNVYLLVAATSVLLTACGDKETAKIDKPESQIVAKVNNDEISVHQVNFQLARIGGLDEAHSKLVSRKILGRLVEQQLLKEQALLAKLDRDPRIVQAVESSTDEILAQAYLDQQLSKATKPSVTDINNFYQENPALFSSRRVFRLQELVIDSSNGKQAEIESNLKNLKDINEVASWLKSNNYKFSANSNVKSAEQLPMDILKKLQPLKDGEMIILPTTRTVNVVYLVASQAMPITNEKATPIIEQYLLNKAKTSLAKTQMDALKAQAKVEFKGDFSDMKVGDSTETAAVEKALPEAQDQPASDKPNQIDNKSTPNQADLEKGLSGL
jgi:EpsD family peptidyl-prolyl cis-trans isomerase